MPNYIAFNAWEGFAPLAQYNSKRASHARVLVLMYIALRSASGYFWGEVETVAEDNVLSRGEAGRLIKDLEAVDALELIPHNKIPDHIKKLIETDHALKPAKKVWRITGAFIIAEKRYEYEWTGTGGAKKQSLNVQKVNILNVQNPECSLSEHNSIDIKEKEEREKDSVAPTVATTTAAQLPTLTPIEHREPIRLIFTIGKRGQSKRHYATTPDGFEPLCGGSKRSGKSTGAGWGYECTHDLNYVDLCQDCAAIAAGEKPAPTPKPRRLVDMTNLELERPQPAGLSPDKLKEWFKQKPFADFFANWEVWNRTEGFQDRTLAGYKASALPDDRKEIYIIASQLGGELERLAKNNNITFTLELLSAFEDWYLDNTFQEKPMAEKKFPTTIDKFRRNILLYLNYLRQLERAS